MRLSASLMSGHSSITLEDEEVDMVLPDVVTANPSPLPPPSSTLHNGMMKMMIADDSNGENSGSGLTC